MYYIIAAHGKYAEGCKSSCEMITGDTSAFIPVTFTEEMTKEDVEKKYETILAEKGAEECRAIIADLPGGTPYNAAMRIVSEYKNIQLIAGLSQQLLVLINSGEELADAIAQTGEIYGNANIAKEKKKVESPKEPVEKNGIVNFRLDERLIHGQVATFWTRTLQADRIIIADDEVLKDEIGVSALKAAVPSGVHLSILTVDNAAARLNAGIYSGQRVFLIVNKTKTIQRLIEKGLKVKEVNIGNMGKKKAESELKNPYTAPRRNWLILKRLKKQVLRFLHRWFRMMKKKTFRSYLR